MTRILLSLSLLCLVLATGRVAVAQERGLVPVQHRVALVIGNSRYETMPLKNPANDARAMARMLRDRGFQVIQQEDATKAQMEAAIDQFGRSLTAGSVGLVFYAGHGMQVNGRNYLIPVDAQIEAESSVRLRAVDAEALLEQLRNAQLGVVILDACRNNPFERRFRGGAGGLAQVDAPTGSLIAYATAPGKVASDGQGSNGLYTGELLKAMAQPGLRIEDVFKQVRRAVTQATNFTQVPWEASSLTGDFVFTAAPAASAPAAPAAPEAGFDQRSLDLAFWQTIQNSRDPADFNDYLSNYPRGAFADLARRRLAALGTTASAAAVTTRPPAAATVLAPLPPAAVYVPTRQRPLPIAIVSLDSTAKPAGDPTADFIDLIRADLGGSGVFTPVARADKVSTMEMLELTPRFAAWRKAGAYALAVVSTVRHPDEQMVVRIAIWDALAEKIIQNTVMRFPLATWQAAAHKHADTLYEVLAKKDGPFHASYSRSGGR